MSTRAGNSLAVPRANLFAVVSLTGLLLMTADVFAVNVTTDPGVRGGLPGAGNKIPGLTSN